MLSCLHLHNAFPMNKLNKLEVKCGRYFVFMKIKYRFYESVLVRSMQFSTFFKAMQKKSNLSCFEFCALGEI